MKPAFSLMSTGSHERLRTSQEDESRIGEIIDGRYRLDALVGRGGMGMVYRAEHVAIRRTVAIKLLHPSLAGLPELRSRFEREALAIGRIDHPNCVNVTDFGGLADGSLFLVMEYLEGRSLGDELDKLHHLPPRRALRILRHLLVGLGHAHTHGIVHRDVKPENVVLVRQDGEKDVAKILDFGIAKLIGATDQNDGVKLTQAGVAFGTPVYMSPEQALGNPVDGRSDLYAASILAYEMLTGHPPFFSDDKLEVLSMHTTREPPAMAGVLARDGHGDTVPEAVEQLIRRGLAKRPTERWASAADYIAALDEVVLTLALEEHLGPTSSGRVLTVSGTTGLTGLTPLPEPGAAPLVTTTGTSVIAPHTASVPRETLGPIELTEIKKAAPGGFWARRWMMVAGAVALVASLGLGAYLYLDREEPPSVSEPAPGSPAAAAAAQLERGNPSGAIKELESRKLEIADDAVAQLQLGHAYAAQRANAPALEAYQRALLLNTAAGDDPQLRANLAAISNDADVPAAMAAFELLIERGDDDARARLVGAAAGDPIERRTAAITLAERLGLASHIDWLTSYKKDLDQGATCARRREAVSKLRALGDPRAIKPLQAAAARKGAKGRQRGKLINACLVQDASAAVTYLRDLAAQAAGRDAGPS
jgi:serine/threonine protein kinase